MAERPENGTKNKVLYDTLEIPRNTLEIVEIL
jgi:hypothetical protein